MAFLYRKKNLRTLMRYVLHARSIGVFLPLSPEPARRRQSQAEVLLRRDKLSALVKRI